MLLLLLSSGANLALRQISNEDAGDRGKFLFALFAWFIVFLSLKCFLITRQVRIFLFGHLFSKRVGRSKADDHLRGVLEYSLTGRYSTLSENE